MHEDRPALWDRVQAAAAKGRTRTSNWLPHGTRFCGLDLKKSLLTTKCMSLSQPGYGPFSLAVLSYTVARMVWSGNGSSCWVQWMRQVMRCEVFGNCILETCIPFVLAGAAAAKHCVTGLLRQCTAQRGRGKEWQGLHLATLEAGAPLEVPEAGDAAAGLRRQVLPGARKVLRQEQVEGAPLADGRLLLQESTANCTQQVLACLFETHPQLQT